MDTKATLLEEYIITRGGSTISVPIDDKEYEVSWNITVRKIREFKYIGKSTPVTLQRGLVLPDDASDFYMFIPSDTFGFSAHDIETVTNSITSEGVKELNSGLRAMYLEEDIRNMVSWIISANYDRVTKQIVIDNFAGHQGEPALMLYELKEEFFDVSFLTLQERNWFIDYLYSLLDIIIGYKLRRAGHEEGDAFLSDGKEARGELIENVMSVFVYPTLLFA